MLRISLENITERDYLDLLGVDVFPNLDEEIMLPCNVKVTTGSSRSNQFVEDPVFMFFMGTALAIPLNILSSYLYDKLKGIKNAKIKVDGEVAADQNAFERKVKKKVGSK